jgi:hypothetical protein
VVNHLDITAAVEMDISSACLSCSDSGSTVLSVLVVIVVVQYCQYL